MTLENIDTIINELEIDSVFLMQNKKKSFLDNYQRLLELIFEYLPLIITSYSDEKMSDIKEDALYWPEQVDKVVSLIKNGEDVLAIIDALYFELRANLIEYKNEIIKRNLFD